MSVLLSKIKEALIAVLPITAIVVILNFVFTPMPSASLGAFLLCAAVLVLGMGLYSLGSDTAMTAIGSHIGSNLTKTKKMPIILFVCFLIGFIVTIAEPDLMVLAGQVQEAIPVRLLLVTIALGVGVFLLLSVLRVFLKIKLNVMLTVLYALLFAAAFLFGSDQFIPLAFDSGGVTTGPITVPFIMALGAGISANIGESKKDNSFGMIAMCSIGPVLTVLVLCALFKPQIAESAAPQTYTDFSQVLHAFGAQLPKFMLEVGLALTPIVVFFVFFQMATVRVQRIQLLKIIVGLVYTYVGLTLFLTAVNVGFMPAGNYIGAMLASLDFNWILVPVGMVVGACIVLAEPAVHVLNKQVEEITDGRIRRRTMLVVLSLSVACAVGLSMVRVLTGISIWWIIIPGYAVAIVLSFLVPGVFTGIAFDSGGVASGPMTTTFLLPLAVGACKAVGGNVFSDAFGVVALVAMTPLIAIQVMGLLFGTARRRAEVSAERARQLAAEGEEIINLTVAGGGYGQK